MDLRKHPLFSNGGYIANHIDVICRCLDINIILSHIQYLSVILCFIFSMLPQVPPYKYQ